MRKPIAAALLGCAMFAAPPARADLGPWGSSHRPPIPVCIVQPAHSIQQAAIERGPVLKISAKGMASALGSTAPNLRFRTVNGAGTPRATAVYELIACQPPLAANAMAPITAEAVVQLPRQYGRIHFIAVKSATNSIMLNLDAPHRP